MSALGTSSLVLVASVADIDEFLEYRHATPLGWPIPGVVGPIDLAHMRREERRDQNKANES